LPRRPFPTTDDPDSTDSDPFEAGVWFPAGLGAAAFERGAHRGDQLVDQNHTVTVEVQGEAVTGGAIADRDADPQHQLFDLDIAVAVAIAVGGVSDGRRHAQGRRRLAGLTPDDRLDQHVEGADGAVRVQRRYARDVSCRGRVLRE